GNEIDLDSPPPPYTTRSPEDWAPYRNCLEFETARLLFSETQMPAGKIDALLYLWGSSLAAHQDEPPFANHADLYKTINSTPISDAPWKSFKLRYNDECPPSNPPPWMDKVYDVWYRDPRVLIKNILANPDFDGEIDYTPY
ncbi:hypothetical protein SCLCIDRAFT_64662, partial [Scleroderma citrinum Foug A]